MTTTAALRVLTLAALLAVRAQTLSNGVDGYYGASGGGGRYSKLDRFLYNRTGLGLANRSEPPVLTTDRGHLSRATTAAATVAVPEDWEDDDIEDDDDEEEEDEEVIPKLIRHKHNWNRMEDENDLYNQNVQKQEPARTMSPLSVSKWNLYGSRKTVEETFRNSRRISSMLQDNNENNEAIKHQKRISKETACKVPKSKVIKVTDVYPSSNKKYIPSCTVLHVCADDTGCCSSPTLKCGPKTMHPVDLHFLIYTVHGLDNREPRGQSTDTRTLLFYNHTECECQSKVQDMMPRDAMPTSTQMEVDQPVVPSIKNNNCKCPTEYSVRYLANGACSCDCFDKQRECTRYKKGNLYFNHLDRYCIISGQCLLPMCDYGDYSYRTGRCPKKFETQHMFKKKHYF